MRRARQLIEGIEDLDSPESFGVQAHLTSPVAHLLSKNGFARHDRSSGEERWVKRLKDGNEVWMIAFPDHNESPMNYRDPQRSGGREWRMMIATKTRKCSVCQGTGKQGGGPCQPCNSTGKQKKPYYEYRNVMGGNELVMSTILGAFLQRLATWPAGLPKPGEPGADK